MCVGFYALYAAENNKIFVESTIDKTIEPIKSMNKMNTREKIRVVTLVVRLSSFLIALDGGLFQTTVIHAKRDHLRGIHTRQSI